MSNWILYGANGYSGKLIAEEAVKRGQKPILAGRSEAVLEVARALGLEGRKFALDSPDEVARGLEGAAFVLHCAGPFSATSRPMLDGCIRAKAHYLDITGEISVFESIFERSAELRAAGISAIPGVGFDVVPTDTVAGLLKEKLPDATKLRLAWKSKSNVSAGTLKSMIEGMGEGAMVRKNGKLVKLPIGSKEIQAEFNRGPESAIVIPWGDVTTAFHTTGIPDIEVYSAGSRRSALAMRLAGKLAGSEWMQSWLKSAADRFVRGPSASRREGGKCYIWGEARNDAGKAVTQRMKTPEGYQFTIHSAIAVAERMLATPPPPGALTPVLAFGTALVRQVPGVEIL
jgi:short subunit dehydrogenase-like uncharacterized protein